VETPALKLFAQLAQFGQGGARHIEAVTFPAAHLDNVPPGA